MKAFSWGNRRNSVQKFFVSAAADLNSFVLTDGKRYAVQHLLCSNKIPRTDRAEPKTDKKMNCSAKKKQLIDQLATTWTKDCDEISWLEYNIYKKKEMCEQKSDVYELIII